MKNRRTGIGTSGLVAFFALMNLGTAPGFGAEPSDQVGREIAEQNCARCQAVGHTGASPLREAPPFRTLHDHYPVESLSEALAEGILTGHPAMPKFVLTPEQITAFVGYLKSLERRKQEPAQYWRAPLLQSVRKPRSRTMRTKFVYSAASGAILG